MNELRGCLNPENPVQEKDRVGGALPGGTKDQVNRLSFIKRCISSNIMERQYLEDNGIYFAGGRLLQGFIAFATIL
jgi:hypothetical protein